MDDTDKTQATRESVWAEFREIAQRQKETDRQMKEAAARFDLELAQSKADFDRRMAESNADFNRRMAESNAKFEQQNAKFERRMRKFEEMNGGLSNNQGMFAEEYFFNSFEDGEQNFFGETFDSIMKNVKGIKYIDEYDILMINGKSLAIIEVKYRARSKHVERLLNKAKSFRINFPDYQNHRVYLGFAALIFDGEVEQDCNEQGIAVIKQVGDTVLISGENLKAF